MSVQAALQFVNQQTFSTPASQRKLAAAIKGKSESDAARTVVELGRQAGFEFTSDEALQARKILLAVGKKQEAGKTDAAEIELSEADLDAVAGGVEVKTGLGPTGTLQQINLVVSAAATGLGPLTAINILRTTVDEQYRQGNSPVHSGDIADETLTQVTDFAEDCWDTMTSW